MSRGVLGDPLFQLRRALANNADAANAIATVDDRDGDIDMIDLEHSLLSAFE